MNTVKIGIHSFAHVHAASYATLLHGFPDVEVLCVDPDADPDDPERSVAFAQQLGVPFAASMEEFHAWGPDAVVVCDENVKHRAVVEELAGHGYHILCEKPLATTRADAEAMVAAAEANGVKLMVAYPVRFAPEFTQLRDAYAAGTLGETIAVFGTNNGQIPVDARAWFADPELAGGGALVDHTVHVLDLIQGLYDLRPTKVRAVSNQILHRGRKNVHVETGGIVTVTYDGGLTATIDCSWSQPDHAPIWGGLTLELVTTEGTVEIAPFEPIVHGMTNRGATTMELAPGANSDAIMLRHFIDNLGEVEAPVPGAVSGVRGAAVVEAALQSARSGGSVVTIDW